MEEEHLKEIFEKYSYLRQDAWNREELLVDYPRFKRVLKEYLEYEYKKNYDPHEEFICPPAVTIDQLIRELESNESHESKEVKQS
jgi:hypothetical protein